MLRICRERRRRFLFEKCAGDKIRVAAEPLPHVFGRGVVSDRIAERLACFADGLYRPSGYAHGGAERGGGLDDAFIVGHRWGLYGWISFSLIGRGKKKRSHAGGGVGAVRIADAVRLSAEREALSDLARDGCRYGVEVGGEAVADPEPFSSVV